MSSDYFRNNITPDHRDPACGIWPDEKNDHLGPDSYSEYLDGTHGPSEYAMMLNSGPSLWERLCAARRAVKAEQATMVEHGQ